MIELATNQKHHLEIDHRSSLLSDSTRRSYRRLSCDCFTSSRKDRKTEKQTCSTNVWKRGWIFSDVWDTKSVQRDVLRDDHSTCEQTTQPRQLLGAWGQTRNQKLHCFATFQGVTRDSAIQTFRHGSRSVYYNTNLILATCSNSLWANPCPKSVSDHRARLYMTLKMKLLETNRYEHNGLPFTDSVVVLSSAMQTGPQVSAQTNSYS